MGGAGELGGAGEGVRVNAKGERGWNSAHTAATDVQEKEGWADNDRAHDHPPQWALLAQLLPVCACVKR